ncbi:putative zinc finger phd-type protein [Neofusicoccum parvum]|nr:putative zinc finger phd-type protein [Neofusicoccum parvum]
MPPSRPSRRSAARTNASSPVGSQSTNSPAPQAVPQKEKGQSSLDSWIEPPPRTPVPSFEDVGFERQGVLTTMQPLGVRPTAKDRARSRVDGLRRSVASRNGQLSGAEDSRDTPDVDGAQQAEDRDRNPQEYLPIIPPNRDEEEDDDYMPSKKKKSHKAAKGHKRGGKSETPGSVRQTVAPSTPENRSPSPLLGEPVSNGVPTGVEKALRGALAKVESTGKAKIGTALRRLSQQSKKDKDLAELLSYIAKHNGRAPSKEQQAVFERYVKRAKKTSLQDQEEERVERSPKRARISRGSNGLALTPTQSAQSPSPSSPGKSTTLHPSSAVQTPAPEDLASERAVTPPRETTAPVKGAGANGLTSSAVHSQRSRSGSVSSISSLSSVDENIAAGPPPDALDDPTLTRLPTAGPSTNGTSKLGIRTKTPLGKKTTAGAFYKRSSDDAGLTESEDEELEAKRQRYNQHLPDIIAFNNSIQMSSIRPDLSQTDIPPTNNKAPVLAPPKKQTLKLTNGLLKKSALQASSSAASPLSDAFPPPGSGPATRATTPSLNADGGERPSKRQKTSARTKHSTGGVAGVARTSGGMESPIGYDDNDARSDNDDFCSACGFSGLLLCCDGCDKAFHLTCCDPPLNDTPDEKWLCHLCAAKSSAAPKEAGPFRIFGPLMGTIHKRNPTVFALPKPVQNHFDGVRADKEGAYEEVQVTKPLNKGRGGWDEVPDNTRLVDAKGNAILCSQCGKSSLNKQQIIQCDVCNANWHLECLDPPMANPPPIPFNSRHRNIWKCPRHIDRDLRSIEPTVSSALGSKRIFRIRKPKNPKVVDVNMGRGFRNMGVIEVASDSSDSEKEFTDVNEEDEGTVYRLPSKGIKLDFISKVKEMHMEKQKAEAREFVANATSTQPRTYDRRFSDANPADRRAAVNLVEFANRQSDLGLSGNAVQTLIYSLNGESPDEVVANMTDAETAPPASVKAPSEEERRQLLALQELIRRRLGVTDGSV